MRKSAYAANKNTKPTLMYALKRCNFVLPPVTFPLHHRASMQRTTATETLSTSWAKKLEIKAKRQAIMAMEKEMRDAKLQEIEVCQGRHEKNSPGHERV